MLGHSRLGKTALWAGASDERFAIVISNDSGEGGAALARRNFGETIAINGQHFPFWFCAPLTGWVAKTNDAVRSAHADRALAPASGLRRQRQRGHWADPKGEFLALVNADPFFGCSGSMDWE